MIHLAEEDLTEYLSDREDLGGRRSLEERETGENLKLNEDNFP